MTPREPMRLNRFLARAGLGARRSVEEGIRNGMVTVNGVLAKSPALTVGPDDSVRWDGSLVTIPAPFAGVMNKPSGMETTMRPGEKRTVHDLSGGMPRGAMPVGRLDVRTGGLLLWTNDGDLAYRLTHPKWKVEREYLLILHTPGDPPAVKRLRRGAFIAPGQFSRPVSVAPAGHENRLKLVITTGRNREVRRLCSICGLKLAGLERIRYGPVHLKDVTRGRWRSLTPGETADLYALVNLKP